MVYSKEEIQKIAEKIEYLRMVDKIDRLEQKEGFVDNFGFFLRMRDWYLKIMCATLIGIGVGTMSIIVVYVIFVWFLHLEM